MFRQNITVELNQKSNNQNKNQNPLTDFYFANTYPDEERKARSMQNNVHFDLKPFEAYIRTSINHIGKSTSEGADVVNADRQEEKYLEAQFSVIKPHLSGAVFTVEKPQNLYSLTADKDFDTESFEISGRKGIICTYKDKRDIFNGTCFVKADGIVEGKFNLYDNDSHSETSTNCTISKIDYADISSYHIEGVKIESVEESETELKISTNSDIAKLESIEICGIKISVKSKESSKKVLITGNGVKICKINDDYYSVIPAIKNGGKIPLFINGKPLKYDVLKLSDFPESELKELFGTNDISVQNGRIIYFGDEENKVSFGKLNFLVKTEKRAFRKMIRDKKGKTVGTVIEVLTDSNSISDLESNTDVFFKETTERLTDSLPYRQGKSRSFKIGRTDENLNLLEIAEETKNGLAKIEDLPKHLYAVPNDWQLKKQQNAISKLTQMPCIEHAGLLELFERTKDERGRPVRNWGYFSPASVEKWYLLTEDSYDGCSEQREFVQKALATPDFAFLDGPPGSGKTTCLLELIAQLVLQGKKVLLTASTNAAVDNILERLSKLPQDIQNKILAVRIGNEGSISETVKEYTLSDVPNEYHEEIIMRANVVCGTIFGILKHPAFNLNDKHQPVRPLYDYLIIDEASKTTFQDFLIPALYSKRWVLSGDIKQLTPYVEQDTIQSSLEEMPEFDRNMQRVQTFMCLFKDNRISQKNMRFYIVLSPDQIRSAEELVTDSNLLCGIISKNESKNPYCASIDEIKKAAQKSVILYGAKLLFIENTVLNEVKYFLPSDFVPAYDIENDENFGNVFLAALTHHYFSKNHPQIELGLNRDKRSYKNYKEITEFWTRTIKEHSWSQELTWRLCRIQELFLEADKNKTVERYEREIEERMPSSPDRKEKVEAYCNVLTGIALPSILQLLQKGLDEKVRKNFKTTTLNEGFDDSNFEPRHTMLTFQHRMHPSISEFSAQSIYNGKALRDGSEMEDVRNWNCPVFGSNHDIWFDTVKKMQDGRDCNNENQIEVNIIKEKIRQFIKWTKENPNEKDTKGLWSVACLTYYKKQERNLKIAVRDLFNENREKSHYESKENHIEVFIYTVDKFQGREADVVFLSFIKNGKAGLGFMDSPNRLNVALTRARFQRVIVGNRNYFRNTRKSELLNRLSENAKVEVVK